MLDATSPARIVGGGGWARTLARVLGVGIVLLFVNAVIFYLPFFYLSENRNPALLWLLVPLGVLIAPAYGWMEYRAARQRNQSRPARAAKIAAIFILVVNVLLLASAWLFYWTFEHGGIP